MIEKLMHVVSEINSTENRRLRTGKSKSAVATTTGPMIDKVKPISDALKPKPLGGRVEARIG